MAAVAQLVEQRDAALAEQLGQRRGAVLDRFGEGEGTTVECFGEGRHALVDGRAELHRAALERAGDGARAILEGDVEAVGAIVECGEQMARALVDERNEAFGPLAERAVQRIAGSLERLGEVAARFDDRAGNALRDHVEIEDETSVALGDCLAHALGVGNHRFALAGEFLDQGAHARFIVGIGALEGGDLVVDHHFELAGAAQRALEAVAQRVDLAAHGLADRGDLFGGGGFGFSEPDRGMRHRGRSVAQVLRAADQRRNREESEDWQHRKCGKAEEIVGDEIAWRAEILAIAHERDREDREHPEGRNEHRDVGRRRTRPRLQSVEDSRALEPVVIGN